MGHGQFERWGRSQTRTATKKSAAAQHDKMTEDEAASRRPLLLKACSLPKKAAGTLVGCRKGRRSRLTYANIVATLALFFALSGVAYAAAAWTGADIVDGTLTGADIAPNSISAGNLAGDSVTTNKIHDGAIIGNDIMPRSIYNGGIREEHLALDSVTSTQIAPNAIGSSAIFDNSVTSADLADNSITSTDLADNSITSADVANESLTSSDIADGSLSGAEIGNGSIYGVDLNYQQVTKQVALTAQATNSVTVLCPAGKIALAGGFGQSHNDIRITDSRPLQNNSGWFVYGVNTGFGTRYLTVYAICV